MKTRERDYFDTGERLSPASVCSSTGCFGSLPFSYGRAGRKKDIEGGGARYKCSLDRTYIWPNYCQTEQVFHVTLR